MRHFLQSADWADFNESLGNNLVQVTINNSIVRGFLERAHGTAGKFISRFYVPYGPFVSDKESLTHALNEIESSARQQKADYLRVEPMGFCDELVMNELGYIKRTKSTQPEDTRIVSIADKSPEEIVAGMNATNRNLWRRNANTIDAPVVKFRIVYDNEEIDPFLAMMDETSKRTGAIFHSDSYYRTAMEVLGPRHSCGIVIASYEGTDMASAMFVVDTEGSTLYYLHAGSTADARKYNVGNLLVAYLLQLAKDMSLSYVDLFGVAPEGADDSHSLYGISSFKRSFGGDDVTYGGTWEKGLTTKYKIMKLIH